MNRLLLLAVGVLLLQWGINSSNAAFTSFHVFGDSLSCTATNPGAGSLYYGKRYSNGRVWVEVLAKMQGIPFDSTNNNPHSYFGNTSSNLLTQITAYVPPVDSNNALVVIWVNNADLYYPALDPTPTLGEFNSVINIAITNQFRAITNLYAKGIRTLIMPNVVDIASVPTFNTYSAYTNLFHQACTNYNALFYAMLERARTNCPALTIIVPDYYGLLANLLKTSSTYGVTNALDANLSIDALNDPALSDKSLNGPGRNYVFWDYIDPTAKVHYTMAGIANAMLSPPLITSIASANDNNRLDIANLPIATAGATNCFVMFATNLNQTVWQTNLPGFTSLTSQTNCYVPVVGPQRFYRVISRTDFPWPWVWP